MVRGIKWATDAERAELLGRGFRLFCPRGDWVPHDLDKQKTFVIGLVGPPASSKSTYIASAIQLLREGGFAPFYLAAHLHTWSEQQFNENYYDKLWRNHEPPVRTDVAQNLGEDAPDKRPALYIELRHAWNGKKWNVVFFDAAGEDLRDASTMARTNRYLGNAYGLIFFVDPASLPALRQRATRLQDYEPPAIDASSVIYRTAELLRGIRGLPDTHRFENLPVAIAIAKADLLDDFAEVPEWQDLCKDPGQRAVGPADLREIFARSDVVADLLEREGGENLILTVNTAFSRHSYHVISAAGCAAVDNKFDTVEPRRCLDPLAALLWGNTVNGPAQ